MTSTVLIQHGFIVTMEKDEVIKDGSIYVSDGRISEVGRSDELTGRTAEHVIDASGKIVIPGFINSHTHTGGDALIRSFVLDMEGYGDFIDYLRNFKWPMLMKMKEEDYYLSSLLSHIENVKAGATTVVDVHYSPHGVSTDGVAEAAAKVGTRTVLVKGYHDYPHLIPKEFLEPTNKLPDMYRELYRRWHGQAEGRIRVAIGPVNLLYNTPESIRTLSHLAEVLGIPFHSHISEVKRGVDTIKDRFGKGYIEVFHELGAVSPRLQAAHAIWLNQNEIDILARGGATVVHNPVANMMLTDGVAPIPKLLEAGVNVAMGTDTKLDMINAMRSAVCLQKVSTMNPAILTARKALKMATINGAKGLGLENEIGSLKSGKKADITIVNLKTSHTVPMRDPIATLIYLAHPSDVETVIVDGKIILEQGKVKNADEEQAIDEAQKRVDHLRAAI